MRAFTLTLLLILAIGCGDPPSAPQTDNEFDPLYGDRARPNPPTNLRITASSSTSLTLSWDDASSFDTGYLIKRSTPALVPYYTVVDTIKGNTTSYTDTTVSCTEAYYYLVVALHGRVPSRVSKALFAKYDGRRSQIMGGTQGWSVSPNGTYLVNFFENAEVYDVSTLTRVGALVGAEQWRARPVAFSRQSDLVAILKEGGLNIWRTKDLGRAYQLQDVPANSAGSPGFNPSGQAIGYAWGAELRIWDLAQGKVNRWTAPEDHGYRAAAFNESGTELMAAGTEIIDFWEPVSHTLKASVRIGAPGQWKLGGFSLNGDYVAFWNDSGISVWRTDSRSKAYQLQIEKPASAFSFSPDGAHFLLYGNSWMNIHETATGKRIHHVDWPGPFLSITMGPGATWFAMLTSTNSGRYLNYYDLSKGWNGEEVR